MKRTCNSCESYLVKQDIDGNKYAFCLHGTPINAMTLVRTASSDELTFLIQWWEYGHNQIDNSELRLLPDLFMNECFRKDT